MTPEERQLLTSMLDKVRAAQLTEKDAEADGLIRDLVQSKPDTPYVLTQAVIIQDMAMQHAQQQLQAAQAQIADLQRQVANGQNNAQQPQKSGGFLSGIFGNSPAPQQAPAGSVPSVSPWGRPLNPSPQPAYAQQPGYAPMPGYGPGGYAQQTQAPVFQPSQSSGFLRGAAQTAMGVAGGALLFQGVESLFGGHSGFGGFGGGFGGGGFGGGFGGGMQENVTEVVNNNYYDTPAPNDTSYDGPQNDPGYSDASFDPGNDPGGVDDSSFDTGGSDDSWT